MHFPEEENEEGFLEMQRPPAPKGKMQPLTIQASEGSDVDGSPDEKLQFMMPQKTR